MGLRKDLKELKKDVAEIKANFSSNYVEKAKELEETKQYLSFVNLKIKNIADVLDTNGNPALKIVYEAPSVLLTFDDDGNVILNELFRSINALNLISVEDQMLILRNIGRKQKQKNI